MIFKPGDKVILALKGKDDTEKMRLILKDLGIEPGRIYISEGMNPNHSGSDGDVIINISNSAGQRSFYARFFELATGRQSVGFLIED